MSEGRKANFNIDKIFLERWSPRAFTAEKIPDEVLLSGFEAARWAPSGGNTQPWRFIYSKHGSETWPIFTEFLMEGNRNWAKNASALIILLSRKDFVGAGGQVSESSSYSLDAGAAWMSFALEMKKQGWFTHGMAGIFKEKIRRDFEIPENYNIEMMIAAGKRGDISALPENLQSREKMNDRQPLEFITQEGKFKDDWRQ
jgi:nitroreductase